MWLALDIGNSALKGGLFDGSQLRHTFRVALPGGALRAAGERALREALGATPIERIGLSSVIPALTASVTCFLETLTGRTVERISPAMHLPFRLVYETPQTLGADRLAAAAAAWTLFGAPPGGPARAVIAIDAGTALTYEVIDRSGLYHGGAIAPGPLLLQRALHQGTAQLPVVPTELPAQPLGRSTREALQAGIMYGFLDSVGGMLHRFTALLGESPCVVATGGWSPLLHQHVAGIDYVSPHLVLHGIHVLMNWNPPAPGTG